MMPMNNPTYPADTPTSLAAAGASTGTVTAAIATSAWIASVAASAPKALDVRRGAEVSGIGTSAGGAVW